jgi:hypothetical protein
LIIFGFAVSRWIFAACGNGFDTSEWMWQIVGFDLLRSRLTQSLFYLHSQPPLLNLGLGIVLKLTPDPHHAQELLRNSFRLMGLLLVLVLFQLMLDLDIPIAIALGLTLLFEFNPGTLVLENWYYAPYPTEFCLCACAFCLNRFLAGRRRKYGIGLLVFAVLPVFLNSSFQPLWFICVLVFFFFCGLDSVRELIPASLIILGLLAILLVKNAIVFGTLTTSSWLGMNLARMTTFSLPEGQRVEAVREGRLSEFALVGSFTGLDKYPMLGAARPTGIPVLDRWTKEDGTVNYNNIQYVAISRHYLTDALWALTHYPGAYFSAMVLSAGCYLNLVKDQDLFVRQRSRIGVWSAVYDAMLYPTAISWWPQRPKCESISLTLLLGLPLVVIFAAIRLVQVPAWGAHEVTIAFILMTIVYATGVGVMFEVGENARFRSVIDPLFLVLLGVLIANLRSGFQGALKATPRT